MLSFVKSRLTAGIYNWLHLKSHLILNSLHAIYYEYL